MAKHKVLVLMDCYIPGHKAGGPIRTVSNMVEALGDDFEFSIVTADRDLGDTKPYAGVERLEWVGVGKARVMYVPRAAGSLPVILRLLRATDYDLL